MPNPELCDYIKMQLIDGAPIEKIENDLIRTGWRENEIREAFEYLIQTGGHLPFNHEEQWRPAPIDDAGQAPQMNQVSQAPQALPPQPAKKHSKKKKVAVAFVIAVLVILGVAIFYSLVSGVMILDIFGTMLSALGIANPFAFSVAGVAGLGEFSVKSFEYSGSAFDMTVASKSGDITITRATAGVCEPMMNEIAAGIGKDVALSFGGCPPLNPEEDYSFAVRITYRGQDQTEYYSTGSVTGRAK